MEAFTLLKYLKPSEATPQPQPQPLSTLPSPPPTEEEDTDYIETTDDEEEEEEDEPFFDIEFTVPDEEEHEQEEPNESQLGFTLSPLTNEQLQLELNSSEPNSKPQFTASFLKSATKLRVFMSGLNKPKSSVSTAQKPESQKKKLFTVKFKVDEVPFASFFTRDNSSKGKNGSDTDGKASQKQKKQHNTEEEEEPKLHSPSSASSDEKLRFSKEVMQKYLKKVKPLYVKVSRKYAEKLKFSSSQLNSLPMKKPPAEKVRTENGGKKNNAKSQKQGTLPLPSGLRVVCKHLGKSRSGSLTTEVAAVSSRRRDDSTVQQQDGIQSAILHCKSSFNASKECDPLKFESSRKLGNELEDEGGFLK